MHDKNPIETRRRATGAAPPAARDALRWVLPLVTALNFVSYLDRQILFGLFTQIARDLHLTNEQLGMFGTVNLVVMAVASVVAGPIADRVGPRRVIFVGVVVWVAATFASALATSYEALLLARAAVGAGEGAFAPAALAMLCAATRQERRARAVATYNLGMSIGGACGLAAGALLAPHTGWRGAFCVAAAPGVLLAVAALRLLPDAVARGEAHAAAGTRMLRPTFLLAAAAGAFGTFGAGSLIAWAPTLVARERQLPVGAAGAAMAAVALLGGVAGVVLGGALGDRLRRRTRGGHALVIGAGFLLAAPFGLACLRATDPVAFTALAALALCGMCLYNGPVGALVDELADGRHPATYQAAFALAIHLGGNAPSPVAIGWIADHVAGREARPLSAALTVAMAAFAVAGVLFLLVARRLQRGR